VADWFDQAVVVTIIIAIIVIARDNEATGGRRVTRALLSKTIEAAARNPARVAMLIG